MRTPSEKAMQLAIEFAIPKTWLNDLARAEDIAEQIDAHTAEALTEHQRVIEMAEKALTAAHAEDISPSLRTVINQVFNEIAKLRKE